MVQPAPQRALRLPGDRAERQLHALAGDRELQLRHPVLGKTVVSFTAMDVHAPAQYIQQWSASVEKALGKETTLEIGYLGSGGFHLQRAHLINNAQPGAGC